MTLLLQLKQRQKRGRAKFGYAVAKIWEIFREREHFSLDYRAIQSLAVFGTRWKAALRGAGFAWVLDLGIFLKLLEVGVSPYLHFIPILSTLQMFESKEAVRGCLIGPKTWDRIIGNFLESIEPSITAMDDGFFSKFGNIEINHALIEIGAGMAVKCGFTG